MALAEFHNFYPYQRFVFWPLWILSVLLTAIISGVLYFVFSSITLHDVQNDLEQIAIKTAAFIPTEVHERLEKPSDQSSDDYRLLELYLQSIMSGNPSIDDIYTLRPTEDPDTMQFVVSGEETEDENRDGIIDESEQKAMLGEEYDITQAPKIKEALSQPTHDDSITYDKWGAWISGYAPLRNDQGEAVGVVGVDYEAGLLSEERRQILLPLFYINLALILPYALLSWYTTRRIGKPYRTLIQAMDRVVHGDINYKMTSRKKGEEFLLARLFNNMRDTLLHVCQHEAKKKYKPDEE